MTEKPDKDKTERTLKPVVSNEKKEKKVVTLDPLYQELNLLRIEGYYFSFDPKAASRPVEELNFLERIKTPEGFLENPIIIEPHTKYGRPGPLAYKILQAILKKYSDYYYPFPEYIAFTQRELGRWVGRNSWGGYSQKQFYKAIMQLRRTAVSCSFYEKETKKWKVLDFQILDSVMLSGREDKINECVFKLCPGILNSLNNNHFLLLNYHRMKDLPPISTALYKHLFYHFFRRLEDKNLNVKNICHTKDYTDLCTTWLGGLSPQKYKSKILSQQLGYHFKLLKSCGLISRVNIEKNKLGNGFNINFFPGKGFFEDYGRFSGSNKQLNIDFQKFTDEHKTVKPLKLASYFYIKLHDIQNCDSVCCPPADVSYARELLDNYPYETLTKLVDYSIKQAKKTNFDMQCFLAVKTYLGGFFAEQRKLEESAELKRKAQEKELKLRQTAKSLEKQKKQYDDYLRTNIENYKSSLAPEKLAQLKNDLINESPIYQTISHTDAINHVFNEHLRGLAGIPTFEEWQLKKEGIIPYKST